MYPIVLQFMIEYKIKEVIFLKCRFCDTEVSTEENFCPHCGMKIEKSFNEPTVVPVKKNKNIIAWAVLVLVLIGVVSINAIKDGISSPKETKPTPYKFDYKTLAGEYIQEKTVGQAIGNINNGGYLCDDGEFIYISNEDGDIVRLNEELKEEEVLYSGDVEYLQVVEGYLYFKDSDLSGHVFKLDVATKETSLVIAKNAFYIHVIGDNLYYQDNEDNESIYQYNMTTLEDKKLNDEESYNLQIIDGILYYTTNSAIKTLDLDTLESKVMKEQAAFSLIYEDEYLYYVDQKTGYLYRLDIHDFTHVTQLNKEPTYEMVIKDDNIYYINAHNEIINMKIDGKDNQVVSDNISGEGLQLLGDYLFLLEDTSYFDESSWYCMDVNGENAKYVFDMPSGNYI